MEEEEEETSHFHISPRPAFKTPAKKEGRLILLTLLVRS